MTTKERTDISQRITDQIAAAIESGAGTYQMPWHTSGEYGFSLEEILYAVTPSRGAAGFPGT